ncbi:retrovirus-related pol polyprotein from transposon TNT 1-94 [Tanacetum coccineum]
MSTQQDIYAAGSENCPPMLNKENYVPWSSRLLRYAKSRPNGKFIYNSIMNGPYVRRMIPEPGDADREVPVPETFHEQTDDELTEAEIKQMEADDQAIQTILLGLPEDIYAAVDSCETAHVQQMMKGSDIGIQEKKAKLFNEWERFTSTDGESIESYYHRFSKLMNDFKRNKHFPEKIASNLKFLNNLQPEWSRHVTIVHQTKDLHTTDYTQLYDFLKYNQKEVDDQRAERLAKTHDPLALMANSNNPFNYPVYPTTAMNMALALMAKAFKLNYSTPTNNNQRISSNPRNRQIAQPGMNMGQDRQMRMVGANGGNQFRQYAGQNVGYQNEYNAVQNVGNQVVQDAVQNQGVQNNGNGNVVAARAEGNATGNNGNQIRCYNCRGLGHLARNCTVRPRRRDAAYLQTQLLIAQKEEAGIQLQAEEFDLMAAAADLDEIEEVNANCILMANLQQASTSGSGKQITTLNEEISKLSKQLSTEKSTVSSLLEEKKKVHFLKSKDEAPEVIKTFLKRITILLQSPVIIIRTDNGTEFKNQILKEYFDSVGISHQASFVRTPQQNVEVERRNQTLVEAARTMLIFSRVPLFLCAEEITTACYTQNRSVIHRRFNKTPYELINGRKPDISFLYVFGALCYPRMIVKILGSLVQKVILAFALVILLIPVLIDSKPGLQGMTSRQISSGLDLTYAPSTITTQKPTEYELDLLFEAMHDDYIGGQPSATPRIGPAAQAPQVFQTLTATTTTTNTTPTPTNSSSQATNLPNTSQDVDELATQQHVQHQPATIADNVPNAMFDENTFVNPFATPSTSVVESSSSQYVDSSNMYTFYQPYPHEYQWTKDHPLE